jgi:hypothetical protein
MNNGTYLAVAVEQRRARRERDAAVRRWLNGASDAVTTTPCRPRRPDLSAGPASA